ncbi:signal peptidase I [Nonomuraea polychroma]|uniref:Signal peptidase I n=1 Tax=Nonomuraea polychroma TaxID=46176 RepID=A0A438M764_9ACTN|nr:signal peptidase I [Nonomuraea polychroma]RVX41554.1 signal peptidase I [Nonomuraea polychroma]
MIRQRLTLLALALMLAPTTGCGLAGMALGRSTFTVTSEAMEPTIKKDSRVSARRTDDGYVPSLGDIIIYRAPREWSSTTSDGTYVSRVIGVPGARVKCCDAQGRLEVDGKPLDEPYLAELPASHLSFEVYVPRDRLWIMSDNRDVALDSRAHRGDAGNGTIGVADVAGVVDDVANS